MTVLVVFCEAGSGQTPQAQRVTRVCARVESLCCRDGRLAGAASECVHGDTGGPQTCCVLTSKLLAQIYIFYHFHGDFMILSYIFLALLWILFVGIVYYLSVCILRVFHMCV